MTEPAPMPKKLKAADVRMALKRRWKAPEATIVFEVARATGFSANRHLDAVAMELWPSRGLALNGIEIKVDLHDWRREKANPEKAEEVAAFCDYFWVAAPKGLIPVAEVPMAWGLLEVDPETGDVAIRKSAEKTEAKPVGRPFLAAMLRAATRPLAHDDMDALLRDRTEQLEKQFNDRLAAEAERLTKVRDAGNKQWTALVEALGENPSWVYDDAGIIDAIKVVKKAGVAGAYGGLQGLLDRLSQTADAIAESMRNLGIEGRKPVPKKRARRQAA